MNISFYKSFKSNLQIKKISRFREITKSKPERSLLSNKFHRKKGRNNQGIITSKHRGGGHKRRYRIIEFKKKYFNIKGIVSSIEYDPNRNVNISLIKYINGKKSYMLHVENLNIGDIVLTSINSSVNNGNTMPLSKIPVGKSVHNIELIPGKGGQLVRSAGTYAKIISKNKNLVTIKLPSKEFRSVNINCLATIGEISNKEYFLIKKKKAGKTRWLGKRPQVRGSAMNSCDHPHGGGEGKASIGKTLPLTPWGKPTLGQKTRQKKKLSNIYILN